MKVRREKDIAPWIHEKKKKIIMSQFEMIFFFTQEDGDRKVHIELKSLPPLSLPFLPGVQFL